jgi:hypothetical protein
VVRITWYHEETWGHTRDEARPQWREGFRRIKGT